MRKRRKNAKITPPRRPVDVMVLKAAEKGLVGELNDGLDDGGSVDCQNNFGSTPLMLASKNDHPLIVRILLQRNANVLQQDSMGWTALHRAAAGGFSRVVECLLDADSSKAHLRMLDRSQMSALQLALDRGRSAEIVSMLCAVDPGLASLQSGAPWMRPLHLASMSNDFESLSIILKARPDAVRDCNFSWLAKSSNPDTVRLILEHDPPLRTSDFCHDQRGMKLIVDAHRRDGVAFGLHAILAACLKREWASTDLLRAMLDVSPTATRDVLSDGKFLIQRIVGLVACCEVEPEIMFAAVPELLRSDPQPFEYASYAIAEFVMESIGREEYVIFEDVFRTMLDATTIDGGAALRRVLTNSVLFDVLTSNMLTLMLEYHPWIARSTYKNEPILFSTLRIYESKTLIAQDLLSAGADVRARGEYGRTVLIQIVRTHKKTSFCYNLTDLLAIVADHDLHPDHIDAEDESGKTALLAAVELAKYDLVKALLARGADVDRRTLRIVDRTFVCKRRSVFQGSCVVVCPDLARVVARFCIEPRDKTVLHLLTDQALIPFDTPVDELFERLSPHTLTCEDADGNTPLLLLVKKTKSVSTHEKRMNLFRHLLTSTSVRQKDFFGNTPLMIAAEKGIYPMVEEILLLDVGTASMTNNEGDRAIDLCKHAGIKRLLLRASSFKQALAMLGAWGVVYFLYARR